MTEAVQSHHRSVYVHRRADSSDSVEVKETPGNIGVGHSDETKHLLYVLWFYNRTVQLAWALPALAELGSPQAGFLSSSKL